jgi:hypothetical protein
VAPGLFAGTPPVRKELLFVMQGAIAAGAGRSTFKLSNVAATVRISRIGASLPELGGPTSGSKSLIAGASVPVKPCPGPSKSARARSNASSMSLGPSPILVGVMSGSCRAGPAGPTPFNVRDSSFGISCPESGFSYGLCFILLLCTEMVDSSLIKSSHIKNVCLSIELISKKP